MVSASRIRIAAPLVPLALAASLLLSACATGPTAQANYDRSTDFTQFKTFGFAKPLGTDKNGYQSVVSQQLMAATQRELEARGLTLATSTTAPQLLVNFNAKLNQKLRVDTVPVGWGGNGDFYGGGFYGGGYYGYRSGFYDGWGGYGDETITTPYTEGTVNIDIVNVAAKKMVWEGIAKDTVTTKELNNLQPEIDAAVKAAFAKYPVALPAPKPAPKPAS